jgi:predicted nucleic acid-binding protein
MMVIDASAVVHVLVATERNSDLVATILADDDLHAPHLLDIEVTHVLRRLVLLDELNGDRAADARADLGALAITRYPHAPLLDRAWALRDNLSMYDGVYISLAELLGAPLVTCDLRLASAPGHDAAITLFSAA